MYFLSEAQPNLAFAATFVPTINDTLHVVCRIIRKIIKSAVKAEYNTMFIKTQLTLPICTTLFEME